MTFLELATEIDEANKKVEEAKVVVSLQENAIIEVKSKHELELRAAQELLSAASKEFNAKISKFNDLMSKLQSKMNGTAPAPKAEPTNSELKDLYKDSTKYRKTLS